MRYSFTAGIIAGYLFVGIFAAPTAIQPSKDISKGSPIVSNFAVQTAIQPFRDVSEEERKDIGAKGQGHISFGKQLSKKDTDQLSDRCEYMFKTSVQQLTANDTSPNVPEQGDKNNVSRLPFKAEEIISCLQDANAQQARYLAKKYLPEEFKQFVEELSDAELEEAIKAITAEDIEEFFKEKPSLNTKALDTRDLSEEEKEVASESFLYRVKVEELRHFLKKHNATKPHHAGRHHLKPHGVNHTNVRHHSFRPHHLNRTHAGHYIVKPRPGFKPHHANYTVPGHLIIDSELLPSHSNTTKSANSTKPVDTMAMLEKLFFGMKLPTSQNKTGEANQSLATSNFTESTATAEPLSYQLMIDLLEKVLPGRLLAEGIVNKTVESSFPHPKPTTTESADNARATAPLKFPKTWRFMFPSGPSSLDDDNLASESPKSQRHRTSAETRDELAANNNKHLQSRSSVNDTNTHPSFNQLINKAFNVSNINELETALHKKTNGTNQAKELVNKIQGVLDEWYAANGEDVDGDKVEKAVVDKVNEVVQEAEEQMEDAAVEEEEDVEDEEEDEEEEEEEPATPIPEIKPGNQTIPTVASLDDTNANSSANGKNPLDGWFRFGHWNTTNGTPRAF